MKTDSRLVRTGPLFVRISIRGRHELVLHRRDLIILAGLVLVALLFVRFWELPGKPDLQWDEPVYFSVANNLVDSGALQVEHPVGSSGPYLFHPPFYFHLLAAWFNLVGSSLGAARLLSALGAMTGLGVVFLMLRRHPGGRSAFVLTAVLGLDGWLVFSSRIALIDNLMFPMGMAGLAVYQWAFAADRTRRQSWWGYVIAGIILGATVVFKHTGLYFLLVLPIHWLITRRHPRRHLVAVAAALSVVVLYLVGMTFAYGGEYWAQSQTQLRRALGFVESRGSIEFADLLRAAAGTYRPFFGTIIAAAASVVLVVVRLFQALKSRSLVALRGPGSLYFSWAMAAIVSFGFLGLWFPQYFMLILVPLYLFAGSEGVMYVRKNRQAREWTVAAFLMLVLMVVAIGGVTFFSRIVARDDNAILEVSEFIAKEFSDDVLVLADEPIGVLIPQDYLNIDLWALGINRQTPDVIVTYLSLTQKLPDSDALRILVARSRQVFQTTGFKETITVYDTS